MQYINGLWKESGTHRFVSLNPATQQPIWEGHAAGAPEIELAVAAAKAAFPAWAASAFGQRYAMCEAFKLLIEGKKQELAVLIAEETGKALWDANSEVAAVIGKLAFATEAYHERTGTRQLPAAAGRAVVRHRPHGVMAVYGPYNFPAHLPNGHIMPALLAGNTVVFKPSEQTPMVAEWLVKQWHEAGIPNGVLNLVQGERDTGIALAEAPIDGLLFTGSTATGKALHAQFGGRPEIILALEMGGNNAILFHSTQDIAAAVHETLLSAFVSTGQRCTCARRLVVIEGKQSEAFMGSLVASARQLQAANYTREPSPFMGPLINNKETQRLLDAQLSLQKIGGLSLLEMQRPDPSLPFLTPGIIDMTGVDGAPDEEYFGPLLQVYHVRNEQEALLRMNHSQFGLSAAIFSEDAAVFQALAEKIRAGLVNWNRQTTGASGAAPFGGVGISGNHRPAGYYSADYCAYPAASIEMDALTIPASLPPGMRIVS